MEKARIQKALTTEVGGATSIKTLFAIFERFRQGGSVEERKHGLGRTSYVVTAKGQEVETAFNIIDASELTPSNTLDGRINPDFPQTLQPRDRTRKSSLLQVAKMAGSLRPVQLADSGLSSHGAPIVGRDGVVESGNGRTMAIIKAYAEGSADEYRQYLIENAALYGCEASKVERIESPVLVRVRLSDVDRAQFARDSNLSDLQQMSAAETAWVDAEIISDRMMEQFNPSDTGNLLSRDNMPFIHSFLKEIGDSATAGLLTGDGRPTKQLIDRVQNAIFAKAYKDGRLVKLVAEEPDPEVRNILNAMNGAAASFVQMQYLSGEAHKQASGSLVSAVDMFGNATKEEQANLADEALNSLVAATELVRQAKDSGQNIEELLSQGDMFGGGGDLAAETLARFIAANNRSSKRLTAAFKALADAINNELQHQGQGMDMFGGGSLTLVDILANVSQELEQEFGEGLNMQQSMFESLSPTAQERIRRHQAMFG